MERREADGEGGTQEPGAKSSRLSRDKVSEVLGRRGGRAAARVPTEGRATLPFIYLLPHFSFYSKIRTKWKPHFIALESGNGTI